MPKPKPAPKPTPETQRYFDAAREGRLEIQRCVDCNEYYFYPRPFCPSCLSRNVEWVVASGRATLHTYLINHRPVPGFEDEGPYAIAIVKLEEGPHLMTNIVGIENTPDKLVLDMALEVVFEEQSGMVIPKFRPLERQS